MEIVKRSLLYVCTLALVLVATSGQITVGSGNSSDRTKLPPATKSGQGSQGGDSLTPANEPVKVTPAARDKAPVVVKPNVDATPAPETQVQAPPQEQQPVPTVSTPVMPKPAPNVPVYDPHGRPLDGRHDHSDRGFRWHFRGWPHLSFDPFPDMPPRWEYMPRDGRGVLVMLSGTDVIGTEFATDLMRELENAGMVPVDSANEASLEIYVTSMDQDPTSPGRLSTLALSYVWCPHSHFITTQILNLTENEAYDFAWSVADYADELTSYYASRR